MVCVVAVAAALVACGPGRGRPLAPVDAGAPAIQDAAPCVSEAGVNPDAFDAGDAGLAGIPACTSAAVMPQPYYVPAFGTLTGPDLDADICLGGQSVTLERVPKTLAQPSQLLFFLADPVPADAPDAVHITTPPDATAASVNGMIGVTEAAPGTYAACGGLALCVLHPIPPGVDCGSGMSPPCPPGCGAEGSIAHPTCVPIVPEDCYTTQLAGCLAGTTAQPEGSAALTLTSVALYQPDDCAGTATYVVHGLLDATLVSKNPDLGSVKLALSF